MFCPDPPPRSGAAKRTQKIRTKPYKSDHFRECYFSNYSASTTYNFNALKCTDFHDTSVLSTRREPKPGHRIQGCSTWKPGRILSLLPRGEGWDEGQTGFAYDRSNFATRLLYTVQNGTKRDELQFSQKPTTPYQPLTTTTRPAVPCSGAVADEVTSSVVGSKSNETDFRGYSCGVRYTHHHPLCSLTI